MTGESLVGRLRAELDRLEALAAPPADLPVVDWYAAEEIDFAGRRASGARGGVPDFDAAFIAAIPPQLVLRTIQAHRAILDRHAGTWHFDQVWMCRKCGNAGAPCRDVRDLASIYFPESDA